MILDKNAAVARLTPDSNDSDKEQYAAIDGMGNIPINIQPASGEVTALTEGQFGQIYSAWTPVSGIYIGDRVTISGTISRPEVVYTVKGVRDWYQSPIPHLELVLYKGDE